LKRGWRRHWVNVKISDHNLKAHPRIPVGAASSQTLPVEATEVTGAKSDEL
jgi:hypothetical protein